MEEECKRYWEQIDKHFLSIENSSNKSELEKERNELSVQSSEKQIEIEKLECLIHDSSLQIESLTKRKEILEMEILKSKRCITQIQNDLKIQLERNEIEKEKTIIEINRLKKEIEKIKEKIEFNY